MIWEKDILDRTLSYSVRSTIQHAKTNKKMGSRTKVGIATGVTGSSESDSGPSNSFPFVMASLWASLCAGEYGH